MPAATPSEIGGMAGGGGGGAGGRLTADSAMVGGRVSFTTASSLGRDTALATDVPPPKIAQPRDHEAAVVVWTDLSLHDVDELLQAAEQNAVALQEKLAEFFDLKGRAGGARRKEKEEDDKEEDDKEKEKAKEKVDLYLRNK